MSTCSKDRSLAQRLTKRVTIVRPPADDEWLATAGNYGDFGYEGTREYAADSPASDFWRDWLIPPYNQDSYGQPFDLDVEVAKVWAAIEPLRGQEYFAAGREGVNVTTRIRIRYRSGIDRTMKVKYKDTEFEVLHIIHPEFGERELQLMCKERQ